MKYASHCTQLCIETPSADTSTKPTRNNVDFWTFSIGFCTHCMYEYGHLYIHFCLLLFIFCHTMIKQCTQRCIIADWVTLYKSICLRMHSSMPSDWLLSYIKAAMMFKMTRYFLNRLCILLLIKSLKTTQSKQIPWNNLDNFISKQIFKDTHFSLFGRN